MEPFTYKNRMGDQYYLHSGTTTLGKPKYFFSRKAGGDLLSEIPEGYTIFEHPDGPVFLQRSSSQAITDAEVSVVERELAQVKTISRSQVVRKGKILTVYAAERMERPTSPLPFGLGSPAFFEAMERCARMTATFQFKLVDKKSRLFEPYRYCYRSWADGWISIGAPGPIEDVARRYVKHAGQESYFELFGW
ncbi:MAG: hypothetical protein ACLQVD_11440 [Capsulimonadaceae bacterium]